MSVLKGEASYENHKLQNPSPATEAQSSSQVPTTSAAPSGQHRAGVSQGTSRQMTVNEMAIHEALTKYVEGMAPRKPILPDDGANFQLQLFRTLSSVLNRPGQEFFPIWTVVLNFAYEHRNGAFHPRYLYRFFPHLKLQKQDIRNFERILNLIRVTADPRTRMIGIKQIDWEVIFRYQAHPRIVQNLRSYYGA